MRRKQKHAFGSKRLNAFAKNEYEEITRNWHTAVDKEYAQREPELKAERLREMERKSQQK